MGTGSGGDSTIITADIVCKEALIALENNMVLGGLVHRDYSKEYQKGRGSTVTIRKPATFTSGTVAEGTINAATLTESSVQVVLEHHLDLSPEISTLELSLDIIDLRTQLIEPMMSAHAQKVDTTIAELYTDIYGHYPVSATPAVSDLAGVRAVANLLKFPMADRRGVLHPVTEADYISLNPFLNAEKRGSTETIREAAMGRVLGIDWYMDQNIQTHTGGDMSDVTGAMKGSLAASKGTCTVDAITDSGTVLAGDVFKVTGYDEWFTVSANATASAATIVLTYTPLNTNPMADNAVVTIQKSHRANLVFHKNCFALVTAPLEPPLGGAVASVESYNGLAARVVYGYTMTSKRNRISVDMLFGAKTLDAALGARLVDAR